MIKQGFIIKVGNKFVNWQGLLVEQIENAVFFSRPEDAVMVSSLYENDKPELVPQEREDTSNVGRIGTYFLYHSVV